MGTVSTNEFRKKLKIMVDGQPYEIIENQFVKPGKGCHGRSDLVGWQGHRSDSADLR